MKLLTLLLSLVLAAAPVKFDKTVHDFGVISIKDGAVKCVFTMTNTTDKPVTIFAVTTSCGCTNADWTRNSIAPGETGNVTVTYNNDDGPYPFDKTLNVYISNLKKPIILHIKGTVTNKKIK